MREYYEYISIMDYNKVDDMLDIVDYNGQPALRINGAIIGTEKEIMTHLRKSDGYDELVAMIHDEELFLNNGGGAQ